MQGQKKSKSGASRFKERFLQLDLFLDVQVPFLVLLLLLIIIRIPSFFEPYWYGDEGIYLTVGNALRHGLDLYSQIFDHKTPFIYWAAAATGGSMVVWKIMGLVLAAASLFFFDQILKILLGKRTWLAKTLIWILDFVFVLIFNLPLLEGNVVNAEIFFVTFGLIGGWCWLRSRVLDDLKLKRGQEMQAWGEVKFEKKVDQNLLAKEKKQTQKVSSGNWWSKVAKREWWLAVTAGVFFSLSFLTKFHGLTDLYVWVIPLAFLPLLKLKEKKNAVIGLVIGFFTPILLTGIAFLIQGNLVDFWRAAFEYSFSYSEYAQISDHALIKFLFSTSGRVVVVLLTTGLLWWQYRKLDLSTIIACLWLVVGTVGAALSNRPYPHYFLQIVPALVLGVGVVIKQIWRLWPNLRQKKWQGLVIGLAFIMGGFLWANLNIKVLKIEPLVDFKAAQETVADYYFNFYKYMMDKQNVYGMYAFYDDLMKDNYAVAETIRHDQNPYLFIWGNNPGLYAQTGKLPITPYVVNYHLYDYGMEVLDVDPLGLLIKGLVQYKPTYAITMHEIDGYGEEYDNQVVIMDYLTDYYQKLHENSRFTLWKIDQSQTMEVSGGMTDINANAVEGRLIDGTE